MEYCVAEVANPLYTRDASVTGPLNISPLPGESSRCTAPMRIRRESGWFSGVGPGDSRRT